MKTNIIVKLQVPGIHSWPECPLEEVAFLRYPHRHMFHIRCEKAVTHDDRDIEIIMFKREIEAHLFLNYGLNLDGLGCQFESMSCEMIAKELVHNFDLASCEVLEDGENGAIVYREETDPTIEQRRLDDLPF